MAINVRTITEAEVPEFCNQIARGFGEIQHEDEARHFLRLFELPRLIAAFDEDQMVGSFGAFTFDVTVPGGQLPMAGTTIVTVLSTHRRRGVLRAMMRAHFDEILQRGEPLAGLWASESSIYGRFGYGLAAESNEVRIDASKVDFAHAETPPGRCRWIEKAEAETLLPAIYDRVRIQRPGMLTRHANWWEHRFFKDPEHQRKGATANRYVVYEGSDGPEGYVIYRQKEEWGDFPNGEVRIREVVAATPSSDEALWRHLLRIDLFPDVRAWNRPIDDDLPWYLTRYRRVQRKPFDTLWLRIMNVERALGERAYDVEGNLVIGVTDAFLPQNDGAYELEAGTETSHCRRTDRTPDITLDVRELGAMYFGAHRASRLARAGLAAGSDDALARADRLFAWPVAPWCPEVF